MNGLSLLDEGPLGTVSNRPWKGLTVAAPWRHLLLFSGVRSGLKADVQVSAKTKKALEHAYVRGLFESFDNVTKDVSDGTIQSRPT
jgi:hypothetical protein